MRSHTTAERTAMGALRRVNHLRVFVQDGAGAWANLSALGSPAVNYVDSCTVSGGIDDAAVQATVTLTRAAGQTLSLAPFLEVSTLNRAGGAYAPLLNAARGLRIDCCVLGPGVVPVEADWRRLLDGKIDRVAWQSDPMTISGRSADAWLLNRFIEVEAPYGSVAGVALETVLQQLIDANPPKNAPVTLVTPVSPGWMVGPFSQQRQSLSEAIRALALQIGWDVRYRWTGATTQALTLYAPARTKTIPDAQFGPGEYFDVTQLELGDDDVRNAGRLRYRDRVTGQQADVTQSDAPSITEFGRRYFEIVEEASGNIDSAAEATAMLAAAISDLRYPEASQAIETGLYWPVEPGDLHRYEANGVHYDEPVDLAVISYDHAFTAEGSATTTLRSRGKPAGAYRRWIAVGGILAPLDSGVAVPAVTYGVVRATRGEAQVADVKLRLSFVRPAAAHYRQMEWGIRVRAPGGAWSASVVQPGTAEGPDDIAATDGYEYEVTPYTVTLRGTRTAAPPVVTLVGDPPIANPIYQPAVRAASYVDFPFALDTETTRIDWYATVTATDPGAASIELVTPLPARVVNRGDGQMVVRVALASASEWAKVTRVAYAGTQRGTTDTVRAQGDAGAVAPSAPTSPLYVSHTAETITNSVVVPTGATQLRTYRNGVAVSTVAAGTAGATQPLTDSVLVPSTPYVHEYTALNAAGLESAKTASLARTTAAATVPTPTITSFSHPRHPSLITAATLEWAPASPAPASVQWHVERDAVEVAESPTTSTTLSVEDAIANPPDANWRVYGTAPGYAPSLYSNVVVG